MKNIIKILSFVIASSLLISCNDYLDTDPTDRVSDKMLWSEEGTAEYAVNSWNDGISDRRIQIRFLQL